MIQYPRAPLLLSSYKFPPGGDMGNPHLFFNYLVWGSNDNVQNKFSRH